MPAVPTKLSTRMDLSSDFVLEPITYLSASLIDSSPAQVGSPQRGPSAYKDSTPARNRHQKLDRPIFAARLPKRSIKSTAYKQMCPSNLFCKTPNCGHRPGGRSRADRHQVFSRYLEFFSTSHWATCGMTTG